MSILKQGRIFQIESKSYFQTSSFTQKFYRNLLHIQTYVYEQMEGWLNTWLAGGLINIAHCISVCRIKVIQPLNLLNDFTGV